MATRRQADARLRAMQARRKTRRWVEAAQLFGGHRQLVIGHNGCRYVLRITKHGKLILNK